MLPGLNPGDQLLRRELHAKFGGIRQGGIAPSQQAAAVLFFTDPLTTANVPSKSSVAENNLARWL